MSTPNQQIWFNGQVVPEAEAKVSVLTHAIHYGSSVFEGIRAYDTPDGPAVFRLDDHLKRLFYSASIYRIPMPYSLEELRAASIETIKANGLGAAYLRPIVFRGNCGIGVIPKDMNVVDVAVMAAAWGTYLGEGVLTTGIKACISSWQRSAPNTIPSGAKAGGNYLSSQLVGLEARDRGCDEGLALGSNGLMSEGAGENLFMVRNGSIITPPLAASVLNGITRDTVITLATERGYEVKELDIAREELYGADEIFLTGTAAEVTPVRQLDHVVIGNGARGPVTEVLQKAFFGIFEGTTEAKEGWLTHF